MNEYKDLIFEEDWIEEEKKNIIYNKRFTNFLIENNIYDKYIYNVKHHIIIEYSDNTLGNHLIIDAFNWQKTPEGELFWYNIHKKWLNKIK
jgi:hypothetical protein